MRIAREEIFGPVLVIIAFEDEADAIRIANDTPYGLAAYMQTGDPQRAWPPGFVPGRFMSTGPASVMARRLAATSSPAMVARGDDGA